MNFTLRLIGMSCFQTSEAGGDEIYLVFKGKKIWPHDRKFQTIKSNETLQIDLEISNIHMGKLIAIELWEHDTFFDDNLGSFEFIIDEVGNDLVSDLKKKASAIHKYSLTWEARESRKKGRLKIAS